MANLKFNRLPNISVVLYYVIGRTPEGKAMLDYCCKFSSIAKAEKVIRDTLMQTHT